MFQFSCRIAIFINFVKDGTSKIYECKGYNTRHLMTEFPDKGWTKKSIYGEVEKAWNSRHVNMQCDA